MNITMIRSNAVDPDSRVEKEANSLSKLGHNVNILAWDREENYKLRSDVLILQDSQVKIYRRGIKASFGGGLNNLIPLIKFQVIIMLFLIKNRRNVEAIHACDFDTALSAFIFAKVFRKKIVYDIFDYYIEAFGVPNKIKYVVEYLDKLIINNSNAVIITNEARREQIKHTSPKKLFVIHNTPQQLVDRSVKRIELESNNKLKIVYVGVLGANRFLKEMIDVIEITQNWEVYIGGFGELEEYCKSKDGENIKYLGKLSYNDVLILEEQADVLVAIYNPKIPNHRYSSPNKLYEALMLGKPIIVAQETGIDKLVEQEQVGMAIQYNKDSFNKALDNMYKNFENYKCNAAKNGKELYRKKYSWGCMEKEIMRMYENL